MFLVLYYFSYYALQDCKLEWLVVMSLLNTILRVSITLVSTVKELAADDPGQVVHSLHHGLKGVDLKHET